RKACEPILSAFRRVAATPHSTRGRFCATLRDLGEVPEWPNGTVSKTVDGATRPRVQIPPSPPSSPWLFPGELFLRFAEQPDQPQQRLARFLAGHPGQLQIAKRVLERRTPLQPRFAQVAATVEALHQCRAATAVAIHLKIDVLDLRVVLDRSDVRTLVRNRAGFLEELDFVVIDLAAVGAMFG